MALVLEPIVRTSKYSFFETVARITEMVATIGATLFATIDQTKAAHSVGLSLRPTTLLVFGNPEGGTAVMEAQPLSALELPLKVLVWEDAHGVSVAYSRMTPMAQRYSLAAQEGVLNAMGRALETVAASVF